jgi:hypothetical protein
MLHLDYIKQKKSEMKKLTRYTSFILALSILFASCSSSTMIQSNPSKAKLFLDGEYVGETPYLHRDSKIVGSSMVVKLEKDGCKPLVSTITKDEEVDVGAIIGGLFVAIPFLWTMKYKPVHNYELTPITNLNEINSDTQPIQSSPKSKATRLRELKQLLDEKIITQEEFEKEKSKILEMND